MKRDLFFYLTIILTTLCDLFWAADLVISILGIASGVETVTFSILAVIATVWVVICTATLINRIKDE